LKAKGWKKIHLANSNQKRPAIAMLSSDKIGFWTNIVTRDKGRIFILLLLGEVFCGHCV